MYKIGIFLLFLIFLSCKSESRENTENQPIEMSGEAYGSTFRIVYYSYGQNLNEEIKGVMDSFDKSANTYVDDSHLSRFNASESGSYADEMMQELVHISRAFNTKTEGYFDPSVAPLSDLWGFSKEGPTKSPSHEQIAEILEVIGLQKVTVKGDSIYKSDPRFELNFNAITGYVNDKIGQYLDSKKVDSYLIEVGGEILAKGVKPDSTNWTVGIDKPAENVERELFATLTLKNEALATSGNYRKFYMDANGRKIVHTINPKTGQPEVTALLSATVIAPTCAEADATATALMAMGLENAQEYIKSRRDLKFFLIWSDKSGAYQSEMYNGFKAQLVD